MVNRKSESDWTTDMAIRAAWMSFVGGATQGEIADRLGVSSAKVHRLIAHAQREGLVRFRVEGRPTDCLELEDEIASAFGLSSCLIAPDLGTSGEQAAIGAVAEVASQHLANLLSNAAISQVGVGMGRTLKAAVESMPRIQRADLRVISISGSLTRKLSANPFDVVQQMVERTGGEGYYLPVPYLAESIAEKDMFLRQKSVQSMLELARKSDLFVIGIGSIEDEGHLVRRGLISAEEQDKLRRDRACGDLMGRFVDIGGNLVPNALGEQAVGLHFDEVRGRRVIALVGGDGKRNATLAALRTGVITDLVLDEQLARGLSGELSGRKLKTA